MKNTKTSSPALSVERSEAERSEDERGATAGGQGVADRPNPEVVAGAKRRTFTAEHKQRGRGGKREGRRAGEESQRAPAPREWGRSAPPPPEGPPPPKGKKPPSPRKRG